MEWLWLGLLSLPLAGWAAWRARRLERAARGLLWAALLMLVLASLGIQIRRDRPLILDVMVDLSPSTRGATFRDPQSVQARLRQLVPDRPFRIRYFADGEVEWAPTPGPSLGELPADRTRLPASAADAVILMSDGQFQPPVSMPPVFALLDPALDQAPDGRIDSLAIGNGSARFTTHTARADRRLVMGDNSIPLPAGPYTRDIEIAGARQQAVLTPSDLWPENDTMAAVAPVSDRVGPLLVERADQLPADPAAYLAFSSIVLPAGLELTDLQQDRLIQYTRDLGGTLLLSGSPANTAQRLRPLAPLSTVPPQPRGRWIILLDASGSMATRTGERTRWAAALDAAGRAIESLDPKENVSIAVFSRTPEIVAGGQSPPQAIEQIKQLRTREPAGPTGLKEALEFIGALESQQPTHLLLISDADATIPDPAALIETLRQARVGVFAIGTGENAGDVRDDTLSLSPLAAICRGTGGELLTRKDPRRWADAFDQLIAAARGDDRIVDAAPLILEPPLTGLPLPIDHRFRAFGRPEIDILARQGTQPVIARWQSGLGSVVSIAIDLDPPAQRAIALRLQRPPADPRFAVRWDIAAGRVEITATQSGAPWNSLALTLHRGGITSAFQQTAPGTYEAPLLRQSVAGIAVIDHMGLPVDRRPIPSRYPEEFDQIGNDRVRLTDLATTTGGRLILPGDTAPLDLPRGTEFRSLQPALAGVGALLLGGALILIRAPDLINRLKRRLRRV